jgi:hypothetical protein
MSDMTVLRTSRPLESPQRASAGSQGLDLDQ